MGTDAMPPLPPVRAKSNVSKNGKNNKQELPLYDKVFGVTKKKKKKEAEEARNLLNFYDNFEKDLRKALKGLLVDDVSIHIHTIAMQTNQWPDLDNKCDRHQINFVLIFVVVIK